MRYPKTALALLIPALSIGLVGCGGSDSDSSAPEPEKAVIDAKFIDSAVSGLTYVCGENNGQTDSEGLFKTEEGQQCDFSLNSFKLGSTKVSTDSSIVTPYAIAGTASHAVKIASLLQSIDADGNPENGINVAEYDASKLPTDLFDKEEAEFLKALTDAGVPAENVVSFADAKKHLDAHVPEVKGFHSLAVEKIVKDIEAIIPELHKENYQAKLAEYKQILDQGDDSNNADIDVLKSVIEIAEVLNDEHVKQRVEFDYSQVDALFNYDSLLPQAIDYAINKTPELIIKGDFNNALASTDADAKLLFTLANKLITASDKLAVSFADVNRVAIYTQSEENHLTYQNAQSLRAVALTVANMLSTIAAYNAGSDENYLVQTAKNLTVKAGKYGDVNPDPVEYEYGYVESVDYPIASSEYDRASAFPVKWIEDKTVFTLRQDPIYLATALKSLSDAVEIAETKVDLSEYLTKEELEDLQPLLANLNQHLQADNGADVLFDFSDTNVKAKLNIQAAYNLNTAIGRDDLAISENKYTCEIDNNMSMFTNSPTCYTQEYEGEYLVYHDGYSYLLEGMSASHELNFTITGGKLDTIVPSCEEKNDEGVFVQCELLTTLQ
ncbi:hypothetical protein [Photobacterium leiognathi]|uniref:hypothetical protein n=1 Tax=Photobacterium leiognathi TaxID=553611 RepID=UPI000D15145A|nr:hypothetical protein [Photobacterium leiognathi]PSW49275.1 hypothetical protein C0W50_21045 [Photobacterium leiognathi subsp. mandapamensis]